MNWQLWTFGEVEREVNGIRPLLASWEKKSNPAQIRLQSYLDDITCKLLPLPEGQPLFLQLEVDVEDSKRLLRYYDLENYLTPLFGSRCLPSSRFGFVSARKFVGGGSSIKCGTAKIRSECDENGWAYFSMNAGSGVSHKNWKERIRASLSTVSLAPLTPGPVSVRLAWRCSAKRNWSSLWKPTGDAMGPILGAANANKPYHLDDDRIVELEFHRQIDNTLGHDVVVGMWWRSLTTTVACA